MTEFAAELTSITKPDYMEKLGLTKAPFSTLHDEENYYENDNKLNIQKKIAHLLEYTGLVLFIQGAAGSGKTTIINRRILTKKDDWLISHFSAKNYTTAAAFIEKLANDFQLSINNTQTPETDLQKQFDMLRHHGKLLILIIDDIDELKESIIPVLSKLIKPPNLQDQADALPSIRLMISGEDIPSALFNAIPKKNNEEHLKYLPALPLTEIETGEYLTHRLKNAGYQKQSPFSTDTIKNIYLESKGLPGTINQLADQYLKAPENEKPKKKTTGKETNNNTLKVAAASLATLIIITVIFMGQPTDSDTPKNKQNQTLAIPKISTNVNSDATEPSENKMQVVEESAEKKDKETLTTPEIQPRIIESTPPKQSEKEQVKKTEKKLRTSVSAENWINKQNPNFSTLQLFGSSQKSSAENFITRHGIKNDAHIFSTTRNKKPWYSVIYKSYPNRKTAQASANNLPKTLKQITPWIRTFKQIKKDMK